MRCEAADLRAGLAADTLAFGTRAHLRSCPGCSSVRGQHRRLRRSMRVLDAVPAPGEHRVLGDGMLAGILAALDHEDLRGARRAAVLVRTTVAVATVAATAGVVALCRTRGLRSVART